MEQQFDEFEYVRKYLKRPAFLLTGIDLKTFSKMGDRVAVYVLKFLYSNQEARKAELEKILSAVRAAFEYPSDIDRESDQLPAVTFCLLEHLIAHAESPEKQALVRSAMDMISKCTLTTSPPTQ